MCDRQLDLNTQTKNPAGLFVILSPFFTSCFMCYNFTAFTIPSPPGEEFMTFYIKALGDRTKVVQKEFEGRVIGEEEGPLLVYVRGPFGAPAQHVDGYDRVVLISGGIGATPFVSVCKHVYYSMNEAHDGEDAPKSYRLDKDNVKFAKRHRMRGFENAFDRDGDLTRCETWEYARSVYAPSISLKYSPKLLSPVVSRTTLTSRSPRTPCSPNFSRFPKSPGSPKSPHSPHALRSPLIPRSNQAPRSPKTHLL